jgi:hypothetical protein
MYDHDIVPVVAITTVFGAPFAAFIIARILRHAERIEMIRHGMVPPPRFSKRVYRAWRKAGSPWPPPGPDPTPWAQTTAPTWTGNDAWRGGPVQLSNGRAPIIISPGASSHGP